jgi:hypothetical protein
VRPHIGLFLSAQKSFDYYIDQAATGPVFLRQRDLDECGVALHHASNGRRRAPRDTTSPYRESYGILCPTRNQMSKSRAA